MFEDSSSQEIIYCMLLVVHCLKLFLVTTISGDAVAATALFVSWCASVATVGSQVYKNRTWANFLHMGVTRVLLPNLHLVGRATLGIEVSLGTAVNPINCKNG